jgi:hypothetical protein
MAKTIREILEGGHWQCCGGDYCYSTKKEEEESLIQALSSISKLILEVVGVDEVCKNNHELQMNFQCLNCLELRQRNNLRAEIREKITGVFK